MDSQQTILSTAYLPPIQYFTKIISSSRVQIEGYETYTKQSYRNRCSILSCNGVLSLTVPVIKTNGNHTLTRDIKIDYSMPWQKNHWKALESAYRTSAFFDFIEDLLIPIYTIKSEFLIDLNQHILEEIIRFLGWSCTIAATEKFEKKYSECINDFRFTIHPKPQKSIDDEFFVPVEYFQVFSNKFSFIPNLSIVDLLFNEGLNSSEIILQSIKKPA